MKSMTLVELTKLQPRIKLNLDQDLIRSALIAELDAVNLYQSHLENLFDETAKKVVEHIIDEEKEHVAELQYLLMRLDKTQEEKMTEVDPTTCIAK
jgi:rubrerythrin